jgi:hypothetical protein
MPVEIRELVIRAITTLEPGKDEATPETGPSVVDQEAIVQECVRQVMNILKKKEER